ncbi:NAD(P)-binding domain-containing protein [Nannocystis sp. SCPEA4]|uniref:NAD(P)-binding domain-containing protein n=1 Tax=Nannocystis sp. SCPEA4 TaxID=2996787 RepID=UPI002270785B|nr:NAD(P)-binding domain-containing protein [Nannocystis sp. SCPEA4]MCY1055171.1 NAD(P)-binding domain-containing protein [Nannocystis sp. SCPEA4]
MSAPPIGIIGGGNFGWGLAHAVERAGREALLWSRRPQRAGTEHIELVSGPGALAAAELIFFAVPSPYVASIARELGVHLDGGHFLVHISRGVVGDDLHGLTQVLRSETPCRRVGALAGPLVAEALITGAPSGGIVASRFPEVRAAVREALGGPALRLYSTDDVTGAEFASTAVGLFATAIGFAQGHGLGPAAQAMLATRAMAEAARIGVVLGGKHETFMGLAGFGDLLAAVAGDDRPELAIGRAIAENQPLEQIGSIGGTYFEGLESAGRIAAYTRRVKLHAPVITLCAAAFAREIPAEEAVAALMSREVGEE